MSVNLESESRPDNRCPCLYRKNCMGRGKSGLHRTRRQVTPGGREPTESAAENIPPDAGLPGSGKGEMVW